MQRYYDVKTCLDVKTPMRDSVELSADIYLPRASGRFPTMISKESH